MKVDIKQIHVHDVLALLQLSRDTFFTAFAHLNNADDMNAYADKAFTIERLTHELQEPDTAFYFAYLDNAIAGYLKLNYNAAQTEIRDKEALEIERIYVAAGYQNKQIGKQLVDFGINRASTKNLKYAWLGVWEHNTNAIRFYERNGFKIFGSHDFMLGSDKQTDLLMKKELILLL